MSFNGRNLGQTQTKNRFEMPYRSLLSESLLFPAWLCGLADELFAFDHDFAGPARSFVVL